MISNNAGFSLVELLVAMVITLIGMMGLLQGVNLAIDTNLANGMRNESVAVAEQIMSEAKQRPFDNISTVETRLPVQSARFRNSFKSYSVVRNVIARGANSKEIQVGVSWKHRGTRFQHAISTVVSKNN